MFYSKKLKKIKKIKHCFFSRKNGFSKGIYKSLNCGRGSKDNKTDVNKNLSFVAKKMNVIENNLILMHQSHSSKVIEITKNNYLVKNKCSYIININNFSNFSYFNLSFVIMYNCRYYLY